MADIILHRRSFDTGSVPTTHSLGVAQFAINVPDGKVFIHKSSSVSESIVSVVTTDSITTGSITLTGTASADLFIGFFSGSFSGSIKDADSASFLKAEQPFIDFSTGSAISTWKSGRLFWDTGSDTLALYSSASGVMLNIGQENWTRVYNDSGITITDGTVVRLTGTHGDVPQVVKAAAIQVSGAINFENQVLGVATHDIGAGAFGMITTQGLVKGLNTNAFNDGDTLYISSSAGLLTNVAPSAPWEIIPIGQVVKAGPGTSGIIYVSVQQPMDFSDLSSVKVEGTYTLGDLFAYQRSGSVNVWRHTSELTGSLRLSGSLSISGSQSISGSLTVSSSVKVLGDQIITGSLIVSNSVTTIGTQILTGSFNLTGSLVASSSTIHMYQSTSVSGTNIFGTASWTNTALSASYVANTVAKMVYVSSGSGLDTNDGSALRPVRTISQSIVLMGNQAGRIAIHPGTYPESVTVTQANVTLASSTPGQGGDTYISGTVTYNNSTGAGKVVDLTVNSLVITGSANMYVDNVTVLVSMNKTGNGSYTEIFNSAIQGSTFSNITGPGTVVFRNGKEQLLYISNSAAVVSIKDSISSVSPTLLQGTLAIFDSIIYSAASGSAAVTTAVGSVFGMTNTQVFNPLGQSERVTLAGFYSYENCTFNRLNSTLGTAVAARGEFQQVRADGITGSFTGSFVGTVTNADTASFANSGFTINSSSIFSLARTSSAVGVNSFSIATGSSRGSVLQYTVASQSNGRTGQVMTSWVGSNIVFNETHTPDIGNTSGVSFTSSLQSSHSVYTFGTATAGWNIEFLVTQI